MSEPKRYKLRPIFWDYTQKKSVSKDQIDAMGNESAYSHADGDWVKWDDYARLKAEVERLNWIVNFVYANNSDIFDEAFDAWNAAKEGKQPNG